MDVALVALGASTVLALIILGDGRKEQEAFKEKWKSKEGAILSPSELPINGQVVPFKLIKENPVLPILLDGDNVLTCWIVDSGYGFTAIDSGLAKRLKLQDTGRLSVQTLKTDSLVSTMLPSGFIYDMNTDQAVVGVPQHSAVIRDLPGTLEQTWGRNSGTSCVKQGGILGITFLRHFVTRLDYRNKTMTFYDPNRFKYRGNGDVFRKFLDVEHYFLIPMTINGVTANMALDTGAFATIMTKGFLKKYKAATGENFDASGTRGTVEASFSENLTSLKKKVVSRANIANHVFERTVILFPDCNGNTECPGLLETSRFDGLLGYSILKNFVIYLIYDPIPYVVFEYA